MLRLQALTPLLGALLLCAASSSAQDAPSLSGKPTSGDYTPPTVSLDSLLRSDKTLSDAVMAYTQSGDSATFRRIIQSEASAGNVRAQLLLAEQYIPEQCAYDPSHDFPNCGPNSKHTPKVIFPTNPLDLPASYEDAAQWLQRASSQGLGEASEILAQLITRMLSNGHPTTYTPADSERLHALARSQGFDVEPLSVMCYQLTPQPSPTPATLTVDGSQRRLLTVGVDPPKPFSADELQALESNGATGTLHFGGETTDGESVLLSRPAGTPAHIRIILDHDPAHEVHLPIPAHHDVIYLQYGDTFITLPSGVPTLPRFISLTPQSTDLQQVSVYVQHIDGSFSGTFCARF